MEDSQSGKMTKRGGPVRLETDYYRVQMPQQVFLESDGFIRFPIEIDPPRKDDSEFNGLIQIRANMDDIGFDDVGEGMMVLRVVNGQRKRSLLIDPQSDLIEKRCPLSASKQDKMFLFPGPSKIFLSTRIMLKRSGGTGSHFPALTTGKPSDKIQGIHFVSTVQPVLEKHDATPT